MIRVVVLDAGPIGLLCHTRSSSLVVACRQWLQNLLAANNRVFIPEIADYEVRRELLRMNRARALSHLNRLGTQLEYLPISTPAMRLAADLWAQARQQGQSTAADNTIDSDVILAAQALTAGLSNVIVATTNVGHLARFVASEIWQNVPTT